MLPEIWPFLPLHADHGTWKPPLLILFGNSFFLYANGSFFYAGFGWVLF